MFKLEHFVRPASMGLAQEAERKGMPVMEMCLDTSWNQRCWSCGLHHGWACECGGKQRAYQEHVARVNGPGPGRLYPNAPRWVELRLNLFPSDFEKSDREVGQTKKSDAPMENSDKESGRVCECGCGAIIGHLSPQARFSSEACRKRAYRERGK